MHSRYPGGRGLFEEPPSTRPSEESRKKAVPMKRPPGEKNFSISGFLQNFKIDWDAGDILLILILLFLFLESDDEEILIMLALVLFSGF